MITGIRGLCNGLGPAFFGLIFSVFHVDVNEIASENDEISTPAPVDISKNTTLHDEGIE